MGWPKGKPRKPDAGTPLTNSSADKPGKLPAWEDINHFTPREFTCNCEGLCDHPVEISMDLVKKLEKVRELIGMPIKITSGTRCTRYNARVGGRINSSHISRNNVSHAADIYCPDSSFRFAFLAAALPIFDRIGMGKDFIHVDIDPDLPARLIWLY